MKSKKESLDEQTLDTITKSTSTSQASSDSSNETSSQKRSFCEAFGLALNPLVDQNNSQLENVTKLNSLHITTKSLKSPDQSATVRGNSFYPSQKKPRVSHASQTSSSMPKSKPRSTPIVHEQNKQMIETELYSKIRLK